MYAIIDRDSDADVVKWLLKHGANPRIKSLSFDVDALGLAESRGNKEVQDVLREYLK